MVVLASNPSIGETEDLNLKANLRSPCLGFLRTGRLFQKTVLNYFLVQMPRVYIKTPRTSLNKIILKLLLYT